MVINRLRGFRRDTFKLEPLITFFWLETPFILFKIGIFRVKNDHWRASKGWLYPPTYCEHYVVDQLWFGNIYHVV